MHLITLRRTTLDRILLDEGSARCRELYLTKHNIHIRQASMPPAGFEPAIPESERRLGYYCLFYGFVLQRCQ